MDYQIDFFVSLYFSKFKSRVHAIEKWKYLFHVTLKG